MRSFFYVFRLQLEREEQQEKEKDNAKFTAEQNGSAFDIMINGAVHLYSVHSCRFTLKLVCSICIWLFIQNRIHTNKYARTHALSVRCYILHCAVHFSSVSADHRLFIVKQTAFQPFNQFVSIHFNKKKKQWPIYLHLKFLYLEKCVAFQTKNRIPFNIWLG